MLTSVNNKQIAFRLIKISSVLNVSVKIFVFESEMKSLKRSKKKFFIFLIEKSFSFETRSSEQPRRLFQLKSDNF